MADNEIKVIEGVYPVTVDSAIYIENTNEKLSEKLQNMQQNMQNENNKWKGKSWIILGDSFGDSSNSHPKYYNFTRDLLGLTILQNYSIGGLRYCVKKFETSDEGVDDDYNLISKLNNFNLLNADVITLALGINDFFSCSPIIEPKGDYGSNFDTNTFTGAVEYTLKHIFENTMIDGRKPPLVILVTPTKSTTVGETNRIGKRPEDYAENIRKIADMWGLPVCDWLRGSGWNKYTCNKPANGYASDGCHPTLYGAERIGTLLANTIKLY